MFRPNLTATLFNKPTHFSLSIPMFFQGLAKDVREDLIDHFKSHEGKWNPISKTWDFPPSSKVPLFKVLSAFNIRVTMPPMAETEAAEKDRKLREALDKQKSLVVAPKPAELIVEPPRKVLVQVPETLIGPEHPAVKRMIESAYARLEQEFYKLHMETGVCKTKMREILSRAVPAVPSPIFQKQA